MQNKPYKLKVIEKLVLHETNGVFIFDETHIAITEEGQKVHVEN